MNSHTQPTAFTFIFEPEKDKKSAVRGQQLASRLHHNVFTEVSVRVARRRFAFKISSWRIIVSYISVAAQI